MLTINATDTLYCQFEHHMCYRFWMASSESLAFAKGKTNVQPSRNRLHPHAALPLIRFPFWQEGQLIPTGDLGVVEVDFETGFVDELGGVERLSK